MRIKGVISQGHGVASGNSGDVRYPGGTLNQQLPYFKERGLDLSTFYPGTINLDIAPYSFELGQPKHFFRAIDWSSYIPAENFYFFDVVAHFEGKRFEGLIYMPDPETKVEHEQKNSILELILPKIDGLSYGNIIEIEVPESQMSFQILGK